MYRLTRDRLMAERQAAATNATLQLQVSSRLMTDCFVYKSCHHMRVSWGSKDHRAEQKMLQHILQVARHHLQLLRSICVSPLQLCLQVGKPALALQKLLLQKLLLLNLCLLALS